jgi:hypothetical protein
MNEDFLCLVFLLGFPKEEAGKLHSYSFSPWLKFSLTRSPVFAYSTYGSRRERRRMGTGQPGNLADVGKPEKACNQKAVSRQHSAFSHGV